MSPGPTQGKLSVLRSLTPGNIYILQDETFQACLKDDKSTKHWLAQLLKNIEAMSSQGGGQGGGGTGAAAHKPGQVKLSQPPVV